MVSQSVTPSSTRVGQQRVLAVAAVDGVLVAVAGVDAVVAVAADQVVLAAAAGDGVRRAAPPSMRSLPTSPAQPVLAVLAEEVVARAGAAAGLAGEQQVVAAAAEDACRCPSRR